MNKAITPLTFISFLTVGFFINNFLIESLYITNFTDQALCTVLVAITFSAIAALFRVDIPK